MRIFAAAILIVGISPAFAGDATITVPDSFKGTMEQTRAAFERCLGATTMHVNSDQCQAVANILAQLAALQPMPIKPPAPPSESVPSVTPAPSAPPAP